MSGDATWFLSLRLRLVLTNPFAGNACRPAWPELRGKEGVLERDGAQRGAVGQLLGLAGSPCAAVRSCSPC